MPLKMICRDISFDIESCFAPIKTHTQTPHTQCPTVTQSTTTIRRHESFWILHMESKPQVLNPKS